MLQQFVNLPIRKRVGIVAIILGFLAIFAGSPYDKSTTRVNVKEMAAVSLEEDHNINVNDLADWIIKEKYDYRLVDLRNAEDYLEYSIPGSENITIINLFDSELMRNEKIILYSDNEAIATQGWFLLKADKFKNIYILDGGLANWKDQVLFPRLSLNPTKEELALFEKKKEVSKFFGGQPQVGGEEMIKNEMPKIIAPPKVNITTKRKKKSREGC